MHKQDKEYLRTGQLGVKKKTREEKERIWERTRENERTKSEKETHRKREKEEERKKKIERKRKYRVRATKKNKGEEWIILTRW